MYLDHFNLKSKPFALSTDPRFLWAGANQRQALATLSYGLQENKGIVVLSGEFGTGKTTLINAFVQSLDYTVRSVRLPEPGTDLTRFRRLVAEGFGLPTENLDLEALLEALARLAEDQEDYQGRLLLVIDEAQGLTAEMQADLLRLACREYRDRRLLHILLVGQTEVYRWAASPTREALLNQVSATFRLHALNESESAAYIELRLRVAGVVRPIFEEAAVKVIHSFSHGVPRAINLLCDFALLQAHMNDVDKVDAEMVEICKDRFQMATLANGSTPEVTVRDLATLPTEPQTTQRRKRRLQLGLAAPLLLLFVVVGFWYDKAFNNPPVGGDKADTVVAPAVEPSPSDQPASVPETSDQPSIPAVAAQKATTLPFAEPRPDPKQDLPLKKQPLPMERGVNQQPTAKQGGEEAGGPRTTVETSAEKRNRASTDAPVKAQQLPTETVIAPPAIEEEEIPKKTGRGHAGVPELEAPSVASEKKPPNLPLGRDAGSSDSQDFVAPLAPTAESPTAADPGDIIDWLIQKKHTGEKLNRQVPHQRQPASE